MYKVRFSSQKILPYVSISETILVCKLHSLSLGSTTDIHVVRRDGSTTPLEITKIRKVVNWATQELSVNSIALWTLVDPYEVRTRLSIELAGLWGEAFESAYHQIEASLESEITLYKRVNARLLFKQVMRTQLETGMPYLWFKRY